MHASATHAAVPQGFGELFDERLPMPEVGAMDDQQRAAARALIEGPRKGVAGPFVALLRTPDLLDRVASLGEHLRFRSRLDARIRELVTSAVARHTANQFEWLLHSRLALAAGVAEHALEAIRVGARPRELPADEENALDFTRELLATNGVSGPTYTRSLACFGDTGVVELTTLVGYFAMVCWVMNVAKTPSQEVPTSGALTGFPQ